MLRRWLRLLTPMGRWEWRAHRRYERERRDAREASRPWLERIRACAHENRRPNPAATAVPPEQKPEVCLDCGVGIVTRRRP